MKIQCDNEKCKALFEPTKDMLLEHRANPDGLMEVYYKCPKCNKEFHVCWHNAETKRIQKAIKTATNRNNIEKLEELRLSLKNECDRINNKA